MSISPEKSKPYIPQPGTPEGEMILQWAEQMHENVKYSLRIRPDYVAWVHGDTFPDPKKALEVKRRVAVTRFKDISTQGYKHFARDIFKGAYQDGERTAPKVDDLPPYEHLVQ